MTNNHPLFSYIFSQDLDALLLNFKLYRHCISTVTNVRLLIWLVSWPTWGVQIRVQLLCNTIDYYCVSVETICPSLHYGEQADANEFYIGLVENLLNKLPQK